MSKKAEKTSVETLTEELLINRKNGFMDVTDEQVKKADKFCEGYKTFLNKAKTEREAVFETIAYAEKNGFVPFDRDASYKSLVKKAAKTVFVWLRLILILRVLI